MGIWGSLPLHYFQSFICSGCSHLLNTLTRQYGFSPLEPLNLNFISSPWGSSSLPLLPPFPNPMRAIFQSQEKYPCSLSALFPKNCLVIFPEAPTYILSDEFWKPKPKRWGSWLPSFLPWHSLPETVIQGLEDGEASFTLREMGREREYHFLT